MAAWRFKAFVIKFFASISIFCGSRISDPVLTVSLFPPWRLLQCFFLFHILGTWLVHFSWISGGPRFLWKMRINVLQVQLNVWKEPSRVCHRCARKLLLQYRRFSLVGSSMDIYWYIHTRSSQLDTQKVYNFLALRCKAVRRTIRKKGREAGLGSKLTLSLSREAIYIGQGRNFHTARPQILLHFPLHRSACRQVHPVSTYVWTWSWLSHTHIPTWKICGFARNF